MRTPPPSLLKRLIITIKSPYLEEISFICFTIGSIRMKVQFIGFQGLNEHFSQAAATFPNFKAKWMIFALDFKKRPAFVIKSLIF